MIPLSEFKEILKDKNVKVDESVLECFRDLVDAQAEMILDSWLVEKETAKSSKIKP